MYKQLNYTLFYTFITRINPPNINFNKSPKIRTYKHLINRVFNYQITYFSTKSAKNPPIKVVNTLQKYLHFKPLFPKTDHF